MRTLIFIIITFSANVFALNINHCATMASHFENKNLILQIQKDDTPTVSLTLKSPINKVFKIYRDQDAKGRLVFHQVYYNNNGQIQRPASENMAALFLNTVAKIENFYYAATLNNSLSVQEYHHLETYSCAQDFASFCKSTIEEMETYLESIKENATNSEIIHCSKLLVGDVKKYNYQDN